MCAVACVGQKDDPEPEVLPDGEEVSGETTGTRFFRRVLALDFTGSWCQYCPGMQDALTEAQAARPGRLVEIALHQHDEMEPSVAEALVSKFSISGFPHAVLDWDASTKFNQSESARFTSYVDKAMKGKACGLAAESSTASGGLKLTVRVKPVGTASCTVMAALVEDGIISTQTGYGENYVNKAVLRSLLGGGLNGTALGELKDGEGEVQINAAVPERPDKHRIVVFVLQNGVAVNAVGMDLNDKKEYEYEKDSD